jgi:hypothetical protein
LQDQVLSDLQLGRENDSYKIVPSPRELGSIDGRIVDELNGLAIDGDPLYLQKPG